MISRSFSSYFQTQGRKARLWKDRDLDLERLKKDLVTYWEEMYSLDNNVSEERKQFLREARDRLDELEAF